MLQKQTDITTPIVEAIVCRRLVEPAIFFLEMSKPLRGCLHQLSVSVGDRLLGMVMGEAQVANLREILESPEKIEALIRRLEEHRDGDPRSEHVEPV
jgi:hypothetical protein